MKQLLTLLADGTVWRLRGGSGGLWSREGAEDGPTLTRAQLWALRDQGWVERALAPERYRISERGLRELRD